MEKMNGPKEPAILIHHTMGCLVVPFQTEPYDEVVLRMQQDILEEVNATETKGVVIDLSGVDIIDPFFARSLIDTARMTNLLGARTVLTGLKPGIVASLVDLDVAIEGILTAPTLEDGLQRLAAPELAWEEALEEKVDKETVRSGDGKATQKEVDEVDSKEDSKEVDEEESEDEGPETEDDEYCFE